MGKKLELAIAVLNGAVGDHLARTGNGLATEMTLVRGGEGLALERDALAAALPSATSRVVVLVHGLMCTEDVWTHEGGADFGTLLARDLGFSPLYVRYNSGLPIMENGAALAKLLSRLVSVYPAPIEEIVLIGFSMGGLVIRSACHAARQERSHDWLPLVGRAIYVGTPHRGAPLERVGRFVAKILRAVDDPYTRLVAQLADLRSCGVKDLGDARVTLDDPRHPVPLLPEIDHFLVAGSLATDVRLAWVFGDAMVPIPSATDGTCVDAATFALPPDHVKIIKGASHMDLPRDPAVYAHVRAWCGKTEEGA
ncbi:MAG: alpha/beta hydrolase [Labilithrix sp.]|nr:alpha/beta hydrolase [Labilithrix sp.]